MNHFSILYNYFLYLLKAKTRHGIHSPFIYHFVADVLKDSKAYPEYRPIRNTVKELRRSRKVIEVSDFGAFSGKDHHKTRTRTIGDIARKSPVSKKTGAKLFSMVRHYQPEYILELGTSFGISTMYMALANPASKIHTIEGCTASAAIALKNFEKHRLHNIEVYQGEFGNQIEKVISAMPRLDFAYIDGNHRKEPTLGYFNSCLKKVHNETIMVFDDIRWSPGMEQAWEEITEHPDVKASIDNFRLGIIFFRKELSRQHFVIR
jgi:predicted O-methyltransferase YrrM